MENNFPAHELSVIGGLLLSDNTDHIEKVFSQLTPRFFTVKELGLLYGNFLEQYRDTGRIDTVLATTLGGEYGDIMKSCMDAVSSPLLLPHYAAMTFAKHRERVLEKDVNGLWESVSFGADLDTSLAALQRVVNRQEAFAQIEQEKHSVEMLDAIVAYMNSLQKDDGLIFTGMSGLDRATGGLAPTSFTILSGRSGMGKSDFAITMACAIAAKGKKVLYLSMEMNITQIMNRITSRLTMINSIALRNKKQLNAADFSKIALCLDKVSTLPIVFDEQQNLSTQEIQAKLKKHKPDVIFIDHIGLMKTNGQKKNWENVMQTSKELKQMTMREKVLVIGLVQQGSDVEKRKDKTGKLSDLKGTDNLGNDADMVMFIRADMPENVLLDGNAWVNAYLQIEKNREGVKRTIDYHWQPQYHKYLEVTTR